MVDWTSAMQQSFEYYIVEPGTWKDSKKIENVISSKIDWDYQAETLGSATIDVTDIITECYIRIYLITIQNGVREKHPLGTFLTQTPSYKFDGNVKSISVDAYTPLIELKEKQPPLGYSILKGENIMDVAYRLTSESLRAPISRVSNNDETLYNHFVSSTNDTWMSFISDLIANAKYRFSLDEMCRVLFDPIQETKSLQPIWTYTDDNSSILYPDLGVEHDLYGIPNVVEVIYSNGSECYRGEAINDDSNSPISTINRGRRITHRVVNPEIPGRPTEEAIQEYAKRLLKQISTLEYTVSYTHGYCPVRIGDCVRLNYKRAGMNGIKGRVISQQISCVPGCPVTEKAVFTTELWG